MLGKDAFEDAVEKPRPLYAQNFMLTSAPTTRPRLRGEKVGKDAPPPPNIGTFGKTVSPPYVTSFSKLVPYPEYVTGPLAGVHVKLAFTRSTFGKNPRLLSVKKALSRWLKLTRLDSIPPDAPRCASYVTLPP